MRSDVIKKGPSKAPHRSLLKATGLTDGEINRPLIGVVTSQNDIIPGHIDLDRIVEAVKKGVLLPGGTPLVFLTIGVCDGITTRHEEMKCSLVMRELIADIIECMVRAHGFGASVLTPSCDEIVPDMIMTALGLSIPSIIVSGGPMLAGKLKGKEVSLSTMFEAIRAYENGTILEEDLCELENKTCPTCGSCSGMLTANSMDCLVEVLGLALLGNETISVVYSERIKLAKYAGMRIMGSLEKDIGPGDTASGKSIKNVLAVGMVLGRSIDSVLHLTVTTNEAGVEMNLDIIDEISPRTPDLRKLAPTSGIHIEDLY